MQIDLPIIALLRAPDPVREDILRTFGDEEEAAIRFAVQWAWNNRRDKGMTKRAAAQYCGIKAPHFSNIISGKKHLPPQKLNAYEWFMGNKALSMTIERFQKIRERELIAGLARAVAENMVRAA